MNPPLCKMPWSALTITGRGQIKPCCQLKTNFGSLHDGVSIEAALKSQEWKDLRKSHLAQKSPHACRACNSREKLLGKSRRIWFEERFGSDIESLWSENPTGQFAQIDLNLSNRCNLKCRMCGSWGSHQWIKEEKRLNTFPQFLRESNPELLREFELSKEQIDQLIPHLSHAKRIDFKGGEPFLATHHDYVLERLIELGRHRDLTLHYTTNGTFIRKELIDLLSQFRRVELVFSVEGTDPLYSYIRGGRFGSQTVEKNIRSYDEMPNVRISFNVAIQIYNLLNLRDLWSYLNSLELKRGDANGAFDYTMVVEPPYLSPFVAPLELRQKAIQSLSHLDEFSHLSDQLSSAPLEPENWRVFQQFTKTLDQLRTENIADVAPELASFFNDESVPFFDNTPP